MIIIAIDELFFQYSKSFCCFSILINHLMKYFFHPRSACFILSNVNQQLVAFQIYPRPEAFFFLIARL